MEHKGPSFVPQTKVGVAYLKADKLVLITVPEHLVDELIDQVGEDSMLAKAIRMQVAADGEISDRPDVPVEDLTN
jgi:hypothetical protein